MSQKVDAIYEHGVLRPLEPLDLRESEIVRLSIEQDVTAEHPFADRTESAVSLYDALHQVGAIGCAKDLPPC